jgi:predicted transcriptional regulator
MGSVVDDIMTPRPLTLRRDDTLQRAIDVMDRNGVKRLFVTDESGGVEGVITRADVVKLFLMKG